MVIYRITFYKDIACREEAHTGDIESFKTAKARAKQIAKLADRPVKIEWCYSTNYGVWGLLRHCPTANDVNNAKEQH